MEVVSGLGDGVFWVGLVVVLFERGVGAGGFALAALVRLGPSGRSRASWCTARERERLALSISEDRVGSGTMVLRQGEPAEEMFAIRDGGFVVIEDARTVSEMGPGDWFGEIGLLQHRPRTASVVAATDGLVWRIPGAVFLAAMAEDAAEPTALLEVMADRLARSAKDRAVPADRR